jgi:hypothetical protein
MESDPLLLISPRRPGNLHRLALTPVLSAGDFVMPLSIIFSSRQTNVVTYRSPDQGIGQFIQNPLNTFRAAPSYKWAKAILGSQIVNHSSLTTGDIKVFGAGLELTPGKWSLSVFSGSSRRAIEPDSLLGVPGVYARRFRAVKMGYGKEDSFHFFLNGAYMNDDEGSIQGPVLFHPGFSPLTGSFFPVRPQQGIAASLQFGLPFGSSVLWSNEMATSVFTRDKRASLTDSLSGSPLAWMTEVRQSTRTDFAGQSSLSLNRPSWGLTLRAFYVGDGYVAPGFPYMQTDRIDLTLDPRIRLFDNKVQLQGSFGYRRNNLSETKSQTTSQLLAAANLDVQLGPGAGFSVRYANFGQRTGFMMDTLRLETISKSLSIAPYFQLESPGGTHRIQSSFSWDDYQDINLLTDQERARQTLSMLLHHAWTAQRIPLGTELSVRYMSNNDPDFGLTGLTLLTGGTYRFFQRKMQASFRVAFSRNSSGEFTPDNALLLRPGFRFAITNQLSASLDGSIRLYRYGSSRPDAGFTENLFRTSIGYKF